MNLVMPETITEVSERRIFDEHCLWYLCGIAQIAIRPDLSEGRFIVIPSFTVSLCLSKNSSMVLQSSVWYLSKQNRYNTRRTQLQVTRIQKIDEEFDLKRDYISCTVRHNCYGGARKNHPIPVEVRCWFTGYQIPEKEEEINKVVSEMKKDGNLLINGSFG